MSKKSNIFLNIATFIFFFIFCAFSFFPSTTNSSTFGISRPGNNLGLVAWWTLDGKDTPWTTSTAATTLDKSGNGNTGTLTNMAQATSPVGGKIGQALNFDGTDDYVTAGNVSSSVKTVSFWMKTTNTTKKIIDLNGTATIETSTGTITANNFTSPTIYVNGVVSSTITADKWYHIVITTDTAINASAVDIGRISTGYFPGVIDDVRIYNRALSATEVSGLHNLSISKFDVSPTKSLTSGLVGYWTFDGKDTPWTTSTAATTLDKSGNGNTGTLTNMAQATSPVAGKIGQGLSFDGVDDYVIVSSAKILSGLTNFSVAGWFKTTTTGEDTMYGERGSSGNDIMKLQITHPDFGTGKVELVYRDDAGTLDRIRTVSAYNDGKWHYVTLTKSGTAVVIYIDGASENTGTLTATNTFTDATLDSRIGADRTDSSTSFPGYLDDIRVYNRALSAAEVSSLYNTGISKFDVSPTKSLTSGLVGYWTFDGKDTPWTSSTAATTLDKSGSGNTGTLTNMAQAISPVPGKIGQGLKFDGSNDYITVADANSLDLTVGSISFWMNPVSFSNNPYIIVKDGGTNDYTSNYRFENYVGLFYLTMSDGVTINQVSWTLAPTLNKWTYLTVTWNGSSIYLYADGVQIESAKTQTLTPVANTAAFEIGNGISKADYTTRYFNGSIDDVRIYNRALSTTEIQQLYNMGK